MKKRFKGFWCYDRVSVIGIAIVSVAISLGAPIFRF
jgi:hypothetical protein